MRASQRQGVYRKTRCISLTVRCISTDIQRLSDVSVIYNDFIVCIYIYNIIVVQSLSKLILQKKNLFVFSKSKTQQKKKIIFFLYSLLLRAHINTGYLIEDGDAEFSIKKGG